jgi:hypothetical protein
MPSSSVEPASACQRTSRDGVAAQAVVGQHQGVAVFAVLPPVVPAHGLPASVQVVVVALAPPEHYYDSPTNQGQ